MQLRNSLLGYLSRLVDRVLATWPPNLHFYRAHYCAATIIIGLLVLASFSALAQSTQKLDLALANKAVCKKAIKSSMSVALNECIDAVRSLKLTHDQTLESYPPIEVYNFIKVLRIDNKLFDCRGDLGVSQYNTVYQVGGIECKALN